MARSVKHLTEIAALLGERSIDLVVLKQGIAAARTLLGKGEPYAPVGYFWTDQFDVKIQAYGTFRPDARPVVAAGIRRPAGSGSPMTGTAEWLVCWAGTCRERPAGYVPAGCDPPT